ncbi:hypothetical protein EYF80_043898 [Liparis tanakae]|uniref:Uncharacterized protein n=1 Tax=Liparis tanakae TaxID=230148 RepID=A0A4Z2FX69_9TELE|nr:hypothetical protein EYF80_043898 [Liparis tanakae]
MPSIKEVAAAKVKTFKKLGNLQETLRVECRIIGGWISTPEEEEEEEERQKRPPSVALFLANESLLCLPLHPDARARSPLTVRTQARNDVYDRTVPQVARLC